MAASVSHNRLAVHFLIIVAHFSRILVWLLSGSLCILAFVPSFAMSIIVCFLDPPYPNTHLGFPPDLLRLDTPH